MSQASAATPLGCPDHDLVVHHYDPESGLRAIVAIHARQCGRACGGCRMLPYESREAAEADVLGLASTMSAKAALAMLPTGGAKAVIIGDPRVSKTKAVLLAMGRLIERLGGSYLGAPDVGIGIEDLKVMRRETNWILGSEDPSGPYTALGVFEALRRAVRRKLNKDSLAGVRVAVQGAGSVGGELCRLLADAGAEIVVADADNEAAESVAARCAATVVSPRAILETPADALAPCALGGVLDERTIPRLRVKLVAGAANRQLASPRCAELLQARDILFAPDYVVSAGGLIAGMSEADGLGRDETLRRVRAIAETLDEIIDAAEGDGVTPLEASSRVAAERIASWGA